MKFYTRAALILAFIGYATSLKCYTCTDGAVGHSTNTPGCRDPFDTPPTHPFILMMDCANLSRIAPEATARAGISQYNTCMKAIGPDSISRTCFDDSKCPATHGCFSDAGSGGTVCCCDTDYCNAGAALAFNLAVISAVAFGAFFLNA
ncbi:uncharacterized protein LOC119720059 [Patiria miniata]|uniref:Protein quiver n=1 Tax=Patiria miniata TaxID=46514 RepID=A0A913Z1G1_PATMI|nr:uncharacterized protein LOC119720059 [Patiria miniata]